jgi:hypothetical protein
LGELVKGMSKNHFLVKKNIPNETIAPKPVPIDAIYISLMMWNCDIGVYIETEKIA